MAALDLVRVLIVDDEDDIRALLRIVLSDGSGQWDVVGEATDGDEAIELWRTRRPDAVLLDQRMPGPSGLEVAETMLAEDASQVIVLFSAYLTDTMRERAASIGVRACIAKEDVFSIPDVLRQLWD
jgi:CheY-like chemotaxis protein